jgi:hypothetical protein
LSLPTFHQRFGQCPQQLMALDLLGEEDYSAHPTLRHRKR